MSFTLNIDGKEVSAEANIWTLVLYEQEFGSDMLQDFFGKSRRSEENEHDIILDFTRTNWTAAAKAAWACIKTANPGMPSFRVWSSETSALELTTVSVSLAQPFMDAYFRAGGSGDPDIKQPDKE